MKNISFKIGVLPCIFELQLLLSWSNVASISLKNINIFLTSVAFSTVWKFFVFYSTYSAFSWSTSPVKIFVLKILVRMKNLQLPTLDIFAFVFLSILILKTNPRISFVKRFPKSPCAILCTQNIEFIYKYPKKEWLQHRSKKMEHTNNCSEIIYSFFSFAIIYWSQPHFHQLVRRKENLYKFK